MIISKTPLRLSFVGGGTDIPSFYRNNNFGSVISTSIDSYIYITVKKHTKTFDERIRLNYFDTELVNDLDSIKNTIIKESLKFLQIDERIYIGTVADVPSSTGLGSSSSFAVGLLNALYRFKGESVSQALLAEEAAHIEIDLLNNPIGKQDQYAAAFGGINNFVFNGDDSVSVNPITIDSEKTKKLFNSILTFWTGISRPSELVLTEQEKNNSRKKNIKTLIKMRNQVNELQSVLNAENYELEKFGKIINEGWKMKRGLASNVSNDNLDDYYLTACQNGAIGGKVSGAGGGGFISFIAHKKDHDIISKRLIEKGLLRYKFNLDSSGSRVFEI